jgi:hypothetical protein
MTILGSLIPLHPILVSSAEIPLYNFFNWAAKALLLGSPPLCALDPSVVLDDKVKIENTCECA